MGIEQDLPRAYGAYQPRDEVCLAAIAPALLVADAWQTRGVEPDHGGFRERRRRDDARRDLGGFVCLQPAVVLVERATDHLRDRRSHAELAFQAANRRPK